jgi:outer membrane protein assembly factor BamB
MAWRYPVSAAGLVSAEPLRGCPAVDSQGRVFVAVRNCLLMFPPGARSPQWEYSTGGLIPCSPAIGPDGNVRIHSCDGYLHVVDSEGRKAFDPVAVGEPLGWACPLVDRRNNTLVCRSEGGLARVDGRGATTPQPFLRTRRRFDCTGLIVDDILYLGGEDHYVRAVPLDAERGENAWAGSPERGRTGRAINAPLALTKDSLLLVASQDDHLHAFGLDGQQRWATALPGQVLGSPVVDAQGTIYVGIRQNQRDQAACGMLWAIDGATRKPKWSYATAAPIESSPVIGDDGILYFGDNAGLVHAVALGGKLVWKAELEAPVRSAGTIIAAGLVAFGLDNGSLAVLKCSSQGVCAQGWPKWSGPGIQ